MTESTANGMARSTTTQGTTARSTTAEAGSRDLTGWRVVLVHGVRTSGTMWRHQASALRARGADVVAVDLPGHGMRVTEEFTLATAAAVLQQEVGSAGGGPTGGGGVAVVGLSLGGYVALHWAAGTPTPPDLLVLSSCTARPGGSGNRAFLALTRVIARLGESRATAMSDRWARLMVGAEAAADVAAGGVAVAGQLAALEAMLGDDPLTDLRTVTERGIPVTFVQGQWDHFRIDERAFREAAGARTRWVLVHRAHHLVSLHRPDAYTRALTGELRRRASA